MQKHETNCCYKHKDKAYFSFDSTFRMLQHTLLVLNFAFFAIAKKSGN